MAIIPNDEKFIGLSASYPTVERRSSLINAESQAYTMQDITDTVTAGMSPATNPTSDYAPYNFNGEFADSPIQIQDPQAGYFGFPILQTRVGQVISVPPGVDQTNVAPYVPQYGLKILNHPVFGASTTLGDYQTAGGFRFNVIGNYSANPSVANSLYVDSIGGGYNSPFWVKGDGSLVQIGQQFSFNNNNIMIGILADGNNGILKLNCNITSPNDGIISANSATGLVMMGTVGAFRSLGVNFFNGAVHVGSGLTNNVTPSNPTTPVKWITIMDENNNAYNCPLYQ